MRPCGGVHGKRQAVTSSLRPLPILPQSQHYCRPSNFSAFDWKSIQSTADATVREHRGQRHHGRHDGGCLHVVELRSTNEEIRPEEGKAAAGDALLDAPEVMILQKAVASGETGASRHRECHAARLQANFARRGLSRRHVYMFGTCAAAATRRDGSIACFVNALV